MKFFDGTIFWNWRLIHFIDGEMIIWIYIKNINSNCHINIFLRKINIRK
jgi:hypothetical protein